MMANYNWGFDYPLSACGDANSLQYHFVQVASGGAGNTFEKSSGASNPAPFGVLQDDPESGQVGAVRVLGVTKLIVNADSAITAGDYLTSSSTGQAVVSTGSSVAALALESVASGSGVYIRALLLPYASGNKADNTP